MAQTLTYTIGADRRAFVKDIQNFKIDFADDNNNWVQARQFERGMRQVFVNIVNEDGTPFDLTGCNVWFEGLLPENAKGNFRVIDGTGFVPIDLQNGQFRFDFPGHAFTVAGSYRQAFFRIVKNGQSVSTLEFDLQVLADKVIGGLVPKDWIGPFEEIADKLVDDLQKHTDDADKIVADFQKKVGDLIAQLNQQGSTTTSMLTELQNRITDLETKIKQDGLFTQAEAEAFKKGFDDQLAKLGDLSKLKAEGNTFADKIDAEFTQRGINVKWYGAKGDGVTDDTQAFKQAISEATNSPYKNEVYIPAGKYVITDELTLNFVKMSGAGYTASTLIPKNLSRLITLQWKSQLTDLRISNRENGRDIVDINMAPVSDESGTNNVISDIYIIGDPSYKIKTTGIGAEPKHTDSTNNEIFVFPNVVRDITMEDVWNGIYIKSSSKAWINGNVFENITIQGFGNAGLWLDQDKDASSISHNTFKNFQVQYQAETPTTARAFKINAGVNNVFEMIHTWQDQGTGVPIPSMEIKAKEGIDPHEIRNNSFSGIFESKIDVADGIGYNDFSKVKLSSWITPAFKERYGSINQAAQKFPNLLPTNLISDYVSGVRSPLQVWGNTRITDLGLDDKGYYIQFEQSPILGMILNGRLSSISNLDKFTIIYDFDFDDSDTSNISFSISSGYYYPSSTQSAPDLMLTKGKHQMSVDLKGVYSYYETFENRIGASGSLAFYAFSSGATNLRIRNIRLVPGWINTFAPIQETRQSQPYRYISASQITFDPKDTDNAFCQKIGINLIPKASTNDWFDRNLVQEKQRSNGTYEYTYPIYM